MDRKLLMDLFMIPSQSKKEGGIIAFIESYLREIDIEFKTDDVGNIYNISNKDKPLLSAHMDTVQDDSDVLMSKFINMKGDIIKGYGVIGGDDKCGIYAILDLLKNGHTDVNFLFTVQEENGGIGSTYFMNNNTISHCLYGLVLDRRGSGDIICEKNSYGTRDFENVLVKMGAPFGYKVNTGTFSDADFISEDISCANLSVGYYNAHMKNEYVVIPELQNSINYVHAVIKNLDIKFGAPIKKAYSSYPKDIGWLNSTSGVDVLDDYIYDNFLNESDVFATHEDECYLCGSPASIYIDTLSSFICDRCFEELQWEMETIEDSMRVG